MLATFRKIGGSIQGFLFKPTLESLEDGAYSFEIERIDRDKRSIAANRLMFGALVNEVARWNREEGNGAALPPAWWHKTFKEECLYVLSEKRKDGSRLRRGKAANGKWTTWRETTDGKPVENITSTTQLNSKEFSEYIQLVAASAKMRWGYPYEFDFINS